MKPLSGKPNSGVGAAMCVATALGLFIATVVQAQEQAGGATRATAAADTLEPAVRTSDTAAAVAPAAAPAAPAPAPAAAHAASASTGRNGTQVGTAGKAAAGNKPEPKAPDRLQLNASEITGNRELPRVMYVVPWRKPDLGDFAGRPPNSLLDEALAPIDRDVFRRQNRYYAALNVGNAAPNGDSAAPGSQDKAVNAASPAPTAKDEK